MRNAKFVCDHCGEEHPIDERIWCGEDQLCANCAAELTDVCDRCGTRIYTEDNAGDGYTCLCERCYDNYYSTCAECGRVIPNGDTYYDEGDQPLCWSCFQNVERQAVIHEYSYVPDLVFHGEGERFFGVELEIDEGGKNRSHAAEISRIANQDAENLYIKTDGSLDDGLELVTHPMSLDYHLHTMPWPAVLQKTKELGYTSHQARTCGLHVHISRDAFGKDERQQEAAIARLLYFVEKFWPELLRFSRRTERQVNRWAARYGMKLHPKEVLDNAKDSCAGRYTAVNLTNRNTIEIRIFRGTLKLNTLYATLQLVDHLCTVALTLSDEELQDLSWHDFLDRVHEPELIQYLKERNLYRNDPVSTSEEV